MHASSGGCAPHRRMEVASLCQLRTPERRGLCASEVTNEREPSGVNLHASGFPTKPPRGPAKGRSGCLPAPQSCLRMSIWADTTQGLPTPRPGVQPIRDRELLGGRDTEALAQAGSRLVWLRNHLHWARLSDLDPISKSLLVHSYDVH